MGFSARRVRSIRRASQRRSQCRDGLGVSELFLAPPGEAEFVLNARDTRLKRYLLGFSEELVRLQRRKVSVEQVQRRAYEIYLERIQKGAHRGGPLDDWLRAKRDLGLC